MIAFFGGMVVGILIAFAVASIGTDDSGDDNE